MSASRSELWLFISHPQCISERIHSLLGNVLTHKTDLRCCNLFIDSQSVIVLLSVYRPLARTIVRSRATGARTWLKWCCDKKFLL